MWTQLPSPKGAQPPQFSAHICCGQMAVWIKMSLGMEVGLSPGDFVLDGDPVPFPQNGAGPPPQFSAHFYCGQTAGCIKMPLGMDVGLSPGDFVLDGDPALPPQQKGQSPLPIFGPCLFCPNGSMHQDATRYGGRSQSRRACVTWGPSPPPQKGATPQFYGLRLRISKLDRKCGGTSSCS